MNSVGRGATFDRGTRRILSILIVAEIAIAAVLLMGSLTLTQHFRNVSKQPWGFATERRVLFNAMYSDRLFPTPESRSVSIQRALSELRSVSGVRSVSVTAPSPMEAARNLMSNVPEGSRPAEPRGYYLAYMRATHPGYFATVGQSLLRGRDFTEMDRADSEPVCIVNESYAKRFWPGQDPIGKRVKQGRLDSARPWFTVVGVVSDTKAIADPRDGEVVGSICLPMSRALASGFDEMTFIVETETAVRANNLEPDIRAALGRADSRLGAYQIISLAEAAAESWTMERFLSVLVSLFGALGLVLSAVGLYGLLSLQVARRRREFGIRSALGATAAQIMQLVARQGVLLLGVGFAVAAIATWAAIHVVQNHWSAMPAPNIIAWISGSLVLCAVAAVACWVPARRASRVDPIVALRAE